MECTFKCLSQNCLNDSITIATGMKRILIFFLSFVLKIFVFIGKPFHGIKPRRLYDVLSRLVFRIPEFKLYRNLWGTELLLTPYYHIDRNIIFWGTYDWVMHSFIEDHLESGMVCFDVGANLGEVALHMGKKVGTSGRIYAFEPSPMNYERLFNHISHNNMQGVVLPFQIALSNQSGSVAMGIADCEDDNQGIGSIVNLSERATSTFISVPCMTIDEFVIAKKIAKLNLIKMDVQGAELLVLEGGPKTFFELSPNLLVEFSPKDLGHLSKTSVDLFLRLQSYGYLMFTLRSSRLGYQLTEEKITPQFSAANVYCTKFTGK